jgi:hypothetical protein
MTGRTFTIDHHGGDGEHRVAVGDLLLKPRHVYRVTAVREVDSKLWPDRWRVSTERFMLRREWGLLPYAERLALLVDGARVVELAAYEPGTQPGQPGHEKCESPTCEGCTP